MVRPTEKKCSWGHSGLLCPSSYALVPPFTVCKSCACCRLEMIAAVPLFWLLGHECSVLLLFAPPVVCYWLGRVCSCARWRSLTLGDQNHVRSSDFHLLWKLILFFRHHQHSSNKIIHSLDSTCPPKTVVHQSVTLQKVNGNVMQFKPGRTFVKEWFIEDFQISSSDVCSRIRCLKIRKAFLCLF